MVSSSRNAKANGMNPWRAGCGESRTSGSEGGPEKPISGNAGMALRSDPYTKLLGPAKWTYFYLYVLMDIFSRYVVGWMVAYQESAALAKQLIAESCGRQGIEPEQLTVHADRGSAMTSKSVALLLADLGITKTHSRPYVSNDNPYSESQFKTLKYRPDFPERFGSIWHARNFGGDFFRWYNLEHHHVGLGLYTPHDVHYGLAEEKRQKRAAVLANAYARHPERFPRGLPQPKAVPSAVWINPPAEEAALHRIENTPTHGFGSQRDRGATGFCRARFEGRWR